MDRPHLTSHPEFGSQTNGSDVAQAFASSIRGKNVCITGVSPKSLGETLAINIARHAPGKLILASRTKAKLETVAETITQQSPDVKPTLVVLDLASQQAVRSAAAEISQTVDHIDILINNAGVTSSERQETKDGIEQTFGANHIGHFLFTSLLTPLLQAGSARVVNVSSLGYRLSPVRFDDYNFKGKAIPEEQRPSAKLPRHMTVGEHQAYAPFVAYGQSKTANILHAVSLNQKLGSRGVKAFAVHPGTIWTDLSRNLSPEDLAFIKSTPADGWITQDQGTSTILVAALDPKLADADGVDHAFLSDCQVSSVESFANDKEQAERLWRLSETLTGGNPRL